MIKILNTSQFMDKVAPFYDEICTPCNKDRMLFLEKTIKKYNISSFLDLSCSTGQTITSLDKCDCNFYGIDLSKQMILVAKEKLTKTLTTSFTSLICSNIANIAKFILIAYTQIV